MLIKNYECLMMQVGHDKMKLLRIRLTIPLLAQERGVGFVRRLPVTLVE